MKTPPVIIQWAVWLQFAVAGSHAVETVLRYPQPLEVPLNTICWSGTQFVAGGDNGVILTSSDGTGWQVQSSPVIRRWLSSAAGGGRVVLGGRQGTAVTSIDGSHWSMSTVPGDPQFGGSSQFVNLEHAHHHAGTFLFTSRGTFDTWTSADCSTWTRRSRLPPYENNSLYGMTSGPTAAVCLGGKYLNPGDTQNLLTFTGTAWTSGTTNLTTAHRWLVWTGVRYVAVGAGGIAATSADGITWTSRTTGTANDLNAIIWTGAQVVAVGSGGTIISSPNGATWTVQESGTQRELRSLAWSGTTLAAVGDGGIVLTSPDGVAWTTRKQADPVLPVALGWLGASGLAVGRTGGTLRSTDGIQWTRTAAVSGPQSHVFRLASSGGRIVAATGSGLWSCPPDGSAWTSSGMAASGAVWDGQRFVAVVDYYQGISCTDDVVTSTDGLTWNVFRPACPYVFGSSPYTWDHLAFMGQRYVRRSESSTNLTTWEPATGFSGSAPDLILSAGNTWLGVSREGAVWTSPSGVAWTLRTPAPSPLLHLRDAVWTGSRLLAVEYNAYNGGFNDGMDTFGGVYDGTASAGWTKLNDVPANTIAWTGTRALIATGQVIFSIEGIPPGPLTWQNWLAQHFPGVVDPTVIGAQADPDGDKQGNLVEYAAGTDPTSRASVALIAVPPPSAGSGARFEWVEDTSRNVNVTPQTSADLDTWDDVTGTLAGGSSGGIVTMRYTAPVHSRLYFRLRVSIP